MMFKYLIWAKYLSTSTLVLDHKGALTLLLFYMEILKVQYVRIGIGGNGDIHNENK